MTPTMQLRLFKRAIYDYDRDHINKVKVGEQVVLRQYFEYDEEERAKQMSFHGKCRDGKWEDVPLEIEPGCSPGM